MRPTPGDTMQVIADMTSLNRTQKMLDYIDARPHRLNLARAAQSSAAPESTATMTRFDLNVYPVINPIAGKSADDHPDGQYPETLNRDALSRKPRMSNFALQTT